MDYVALLSGGKDSCFNLLHCAKNGHKLVAAATLGPEDGKEELDSYMYQTVGQDAIGLIAHALDVPLYRRVIIGTAVEQSVDYGSRMGQAAGGIDGDETEDLYELLYSVKTRHPSIQGVSVGAILSNYQRVRVEHVCRRLKLTALAYLWQRDQDELLSEMIEAGMESVLIKVSGIGLITEHLGKTLSVMQPVLRKLNRQYGAHICGEGGEYETFTLDSPLFKQRIVLDETETVIHSANDFATVAYLRIKGASLVEKSLIPRHSPLLRTPPLLEKAYQEVVDEATEVAIKEQTLVPEVVTDKIACRVGTTKEKSSWLAISNIRSEVEGTSLAEEVRECFDLLNKRLSEHSFSLADVANINLLLSSMDLFAEVNAIYATFFGTSPPARATVAVDLPQSRRVCLECIAFKETTDRKRQALHVQGLSYWAPANIGPYSQAVIVDQRIFMSGQIGMIAKNLSLPAPPSIILEAALSFQHAQRIKAALKSNTGGGWDGHIQANIIWLVDFKHLEPVRRVQAREAEILGLSPSPTLYLGIKSLPKGALVEKQVIYHTGLVEAEDEDGERVVNKYSSEFRSSDKNSSLRWEETYYNKTSASFIVLYGLSRDAEQLASILKEIPHLYHSWEHVLYARLFYTHGLKKGSHLIIPFTDTPISTIPCRFISCGENSHWDFAITIQTV